MLLEKLTSSWLLSGVETPELKKLSQLFRELCFSEGDTVFVEQMPGEALYLIAEGTVRISRMIAEGEEKTLMVLGPEDVFGEMALLDGGPRAATARVTETAKLLGLKKLDFDRLCQSDPGLGLKLLRNIVRVLTRRIRDNDADHRQMLIWAAGSETTRT